MPSARVAQKCPSVGDFWSLQEGDWSSPRTAGGEPRGAASGLGSGRPGCSALVPLPAPGDPAMVSEPRHLVISFPSLSGPRPLSWGTDGSPRLVHAAPPPSLTPWLQHLAIHLLLPPSWACLCSLYWPPFPLPTVLSPAPGSGLPATQGFLRGGWTHEA